MGSLEKIGKTFAFKKEEKIEKKLIYADIKTNHLKFLGINFLTALIFSVSIAFFVYNLYSWIYAIGAGVGAAFVYYFLISSFVSLISTQRATEAEKVLPDALSLMASNLKSGLTPGEAFVLSARPEFGLLADKIEKAGKELATGATLKEALEILPKGIDSELFRRTIQLVTEGLESGGEIATLLESTADDIRETESIRREVRSTIFVYALFIFIAGCLVAPVLYAVSIQLAGVLSRLSESISVQFLTQESPTVQLAPTGISSDFLLRFAYTNLIITTGFSSLIVALIHKGDEKFGLRYLPFFIGIALALFYIGRILMDMFFGGIRVV